MMSRPIDHFSLSIVESKRRERAMLEAINLGCVRGDRRLFKDVNFALEPGTFLQLQGPNGSGKTSLLRILCGLLAQVEGEIRWQGENIRSLREDYFIAVTYVGHRNGV